MNKKSTLKQHQEAFVTRPTFLRRTFTFKNILAVVIISFAVLAVLSKQYKYFAFDLSTTLFIQRLDFFWFDLLMKFISFIGNGSSMAVIISLLAIYGYLVGKRHAPLMLIVSTVGGVLLSFVLKVLVSRPRPDPSLINQIGNFVWLDSFPSGHVLGAVSLYGFLLYIAFTQLKVSVWRNYIIGICILVMILMGLSRIYLGAHWLSDVLGAYLIGFVWLSFIIFVYQKLKPKFVPR